MTDERYVFTQDIRDKKSTVRSASKTNRVGKGPVRFPSDYMSKKERKAMNGEVVTYDMNKAISWAIFKTWPLDIQQEYLDKIEREFKATNDDLEVLFGISKWTMFRYFSKTGINYHTDKCRRSCKNNPEWKIFCGMEVIKPFEPEIKECMTDKLTIVKKKNPKSCPYLEGGSFVVTGDRNHVMDILEMFCGNNKYRFTIKFEEVNNENE